MKSPFLDSNSLTIADIALFAYTHRGEECGIQLADYPAIQKWIGRVQDSPRFVPMTPPSELTLIAG